MKTAPLSDSSDAGRPCSSAALWKLATTSAALTRRVGVRAQEQAGVVVDQVEDLDHLAAGQLPGGDVGLPQLVGQLAQKRINEQRGRFCG